MLSFKVKKNTKLVLNSTDSPNDIDSLSFNYDNLSLVTINGDTAVVANQNGVNSPYGYVEGFYTSNNNTIVNSMLIIKVDSISHNIKNINYYDVNQALMTTVQINTQTQSANILFEASNTTNNDNVQKDVNSIQRTIRLTSCGQAVASCVADAYANHGWTSVWLSVQSAFLPETAAAIAAACIVKNC